MSSATVKKSPNAVALLILAYLAFITIGLSDGLLGVAYPSIRQDFLLPLDALGGLLFTVMSGYFLSSFFSGRILAWLGTGRLVLLACLAMAVGLAGYTLAPAWWVIILLGFLVGSGVGAIDSAMNTYIAAHYRANFMQWLHASYGIGVTLGPLLMTGAISLYHSWRLGYRLVAVVALAMAFTFFVTLPRWKNGSEDRGNTVREKTPFGETLRTPRVWLSISLFFLHTGAEITLGSWAYTLLTESRGVDATLAGLWAGSFWFMFTVGRILAGVYTRLVKTHTLVRVCLFLAMGGALLLAWNPFPWVSLLGVALCGFAIAPIYPAMISGTAARVGQRHAVNTIGMQVGSAGMGGAVIPALAGVLAQNISLETIPLYLAGLFALASGLYWLSIRMEPKEGPG